MVLVYAAGLRIDAALAPDFFSLTMNSRRSELLQPGDVPDDPGHHARGVKARSRTRAEPGQAYGGNPMDDPTLLGRLPAAAVPVLVVWGAADRMIPVGHGQAYAAAIPGAEYQLISDAGHLPQLETPDKLLGDGLGLRHRRGRDS